MQEQQYEFDLDYESAHVKEILLQEDMEAFRENFLSYPLYDQTQIFLSLEQEDRIRMYHYLSPKEMSDMFEILEEDVESIKVYLMEKNKKYAADMLADMYTDNAVDMLQQLPEEVIPTYL
uniref:magnesium transporter MgtE N-terminal domain-containing protein n=1 Tax=Jeotgalibaca porci TaxID=1868793 RepID=UPI0035A04183